MCIRDSNLVVNTSLNAKYDERYGFTEDEVRALANYLGQSAHFPETVSYTHLAERDSHRRHLRHRRRAVLHLVRAEGGDRP